MVFFRTLAMEAATSFDDTPTTNSANISQQLATSLQQRRWDETRVGDLHTRHV